MARDWLGSGMRFPVRPDANQSLTYVSGVDLVRQSVQIILDTEPGERIMLPTFGCGLGSYVMQPNSAATRAAIQAEVTDALARWEPRIQVTNVAVTPGDDPSLVWIEISYILLASRRSDNLVFPFYLT